MNLNELQRVQDATRMRQMAAWERIRSQLCFAEFLVAHNPAQAAAWKPACAAAACIAADGLNTAAPDMPALVARVEEVLAPLARAAKGHTVYLVGHAHIDMNWMWSWPETVSVTIDTFATMLQLLEEFPEFHFSQSQASVYEIIREHAPEMLPAIAARVQEGRWEVTASHWVEGDKNLAGGESLCRHLLYTRACLQELFGLKPEDVAIDWSPDTFGHAATIPTYLVRGGVKHLFLHRPGTSQQPVPEAFWWEAPDGSRVLVHNAQRRGYNCAIEPRQVLEAAQTAGRDGGINIALMVYGVGDHGGGPTRRDLLMRREMASWPVFPALTCAPAHDYFARLGREGAALPVLRGELNCEFTGCYTTQSLIKRSNRLGEARVADAEMAAVFDTLVRGTPYPAGTFAQNWKRVLFSHFHDILPGSGVHDTRTYTHGQFQDTMASTMAITARALRGVAGVVDTARVAGPVVLTEHPPAFLSSGHGSGAGIAAAEGRLSQYGNHGDSPARPFVVFNLTPVERREVVTFSIWDREPAGSPVGFHSKTFEAVNAAGEVWPAQVREKGQAWGHHNMSLAVPVVVPPLGFTTVVVRETFSPGSAVPGAMQVTASHHCQYVQRERVRAGLENKLVRVDFDVQTGRIISFRDKRTGLELVDPASGGIGLEYSVERPHGMSAWCINNAGPVEPLRVISLRETQAGPYTAAIEVAFQIRESTGKITYRLDADDPRLRVEMDIEWFQRGSATDGYPNLRFAIPLALAGAAATYEIPFGAVDRQTAADQEVPALRWARVAGRIGRKRAAMLVLNDCKHGHALSGATLRVNLIRAAIDPDPLPEIGRHAVALALVPVDTDTTTAEATRLAQVFNTPLLPIGTEVHPGRLAPTTSLLVLRGDSLVLSGVKMTEKNDGLLVRVYETAGTPARGSVAVDPSLGAPADARCVDLMERTLKDDKPTLSRHAAKFSVPPFGIASVVMNVKRGG
ncbi:MAG: glycoside hydrolase family 38 C-terminal domain-containing protein [bacterium]